MKKSKFTEAQIVFVLKQSEAGTRVEEICRQLGVYGLVIRLLYLLLFPGYAGIGL